MWHLFIGDIARCPVPSSHRYREITHAEFRRYCKHLEVFRKNGKLIVSDSLGAVILGRLTELETERSSNSPYDFWVPPKTIESRDHVLVLSPKLYGMYIQISYQQASDAKFRDIVRTGIIEPLDSEVTRSVKVQDLASQCGSVSKRIDETRRLLETATPDDREALYSLLQEFEDEKRQILADDSIDHSLVCQLISKNRETLEEAKKSIRELQLRLQVECNAGPDLFEERRLQAILHASIKEAEMRRETLDNLQTLLSELSERP